MNRLAVLACLLVLLSAAPVGAQPPSARDYGARVPLAADTPAERQNALRRALAEVLERVSEGRAPPELLAEADRWVLQFGVERGEEGPLLRAEFDGRQIDRALMARGLPVWGVWPGQERTLSLLVEGVRDGLQYAEILRRLGAVPGLRNLAVERLEGDRLSLRVQIGVEPEALDRALEAGAFAFRGLVLGEVDRAYRLR